MKKSLRLFTDVRLLGYNALILFFSPYLLLLKLLRLRWKGISEVDPLRWFCPIQNPHQKDAASRHIVFISTGFGDMRSGQQLSQDLKAICPDLKITWAVKYRENKIAALADYPDQAIAFVPFDSLFPVWNWLRHLDPDVVVFVNQKWPSCIAWGAHLWGAAVLVVNGRIKGHAPYSKVVTAKKSHLEKFRRSLNFHLFRWTLEAFQVVCLQSEQELEKIVEVVPEGLDVRITGAVKTSENSDHGDEVKRWLQSSNTLPLLAAGSVYEKEYALVLDAFVKVREQVPCGLLIAPRFTEKAGEIARFATQMGLTVSLRTQAEKGGNSADVYLLDTIGELSSAYQFAVAAYVGGTLEGEGHNVIEPIVFGIPVLFGPGSRDPNSLQKSCEAAGVGFKVQNSEELSTQWLNILVDKELQQIIRGQARRVVDQQRASRAKNLQAIIEAINVLL